MRWVLILALVLVSSATDGQQPSAPPSKEQQERLREASRYGTEARKLYREGQLAEAITAAQQMLAIERDVLGNWHDDVAGSLELLAALHEYHDEFETARKEWREVIAIRVKLHGEGNWRVTNGRLELGYVDLLERSTPAQRRQLQEASDLTRQFLKLFEEGKWREAEPLGQRALALRQEVLGDRHVVVAASRNYLGRLYFSQADFARAEPLFQQALTIRREVLGEKHPACAAVLNNLGRLYLAQANYAQAESFHRQALAIRREVRGEQHSDYAESLNNLALVYQARAEYAQTRVLFEQAAAILQRSRGDKHPDYATTLNNLAQLTEAQGDYAPAQRLYEQVLTIRGAALGEWHPDYAQTLNDLAGLYQLQAEYAQAERLFLRALAIRRQALGDKHPAYAQTLSSLALLYRAQGALSRAEPLFREALSVYQQALGDRHPTYATGLNNLALLYEEQGEYARAEPLFQQALAIQKQTRGEKHPACATSLNNLALLYQAQGAYARAEPLFRQAMEILRQARGDKHPDYITTLGNLALLYQLQGQYARAEPLFQQALAIRREAVGTRHPGYAAALNNLAGLYRHQGDYARAESMSREAREVLRQALGERHPNYARAVENLAEVYQARAEYRRAEPLFQEALAIRKQVVGDRHSVYAASLNNLGLLHQAQGDYARAEPLLQQALAVYRQALGEKHPAYATSLNNLAALSRIQADYARAELLGRQALEVRRQALGTSHPDYALSLITLAEVYRYQGDFAKAEPLCRQALVTCRQALGDQHPMVARALNDLAEVYQAQRNYAGAERLFRLALEVRRNTVGDRHPAYATILNHLAELYRVQRRYAQAVPLARQALAIRRQALGEKHPDYAVSLNNLALVYKEQGNYAEAEPLLQQALEVERQTLGERHLAYAIGVGNLAMLYRDQGNQAKAEPLFRQAIRALCQADIPPSAEVGRLRAEDFKPVPVSVQILLAYAICLERRAAATPSAVELHTASHVYALAADLLDRIRTEVLQEKQSKTLQAESTFELFPRRIGALRRLHALEGRVGDLEAAFTTAEQGTARVFLEVLGESQARGLGGIPPELFAQEHQLVRSVRRLDQRIETEAGQPPDQLDPELIGRLQEERKQREAELKALLARLEKVYPQYAALMHPRPCSLTQARTCLVPSEVALLFVPGAIQSYVVLVEARPAPDDRSNGLAIYPLAPEKQLANLVDAVTDPQALILPARSRSQGRRAYQELLAPLEERLHGKDLVIVPGGPLGYLPFELLVGPDGKFLVESRRIRYAPSLTALHMVRLWEKGRRRPDRPLWGLGDPVFDLRDPRVQGKGTVTGATQELLNEYRAQLPWSGSAGRLVFERLPATATEVAAIGEALQAQPEAVVTGLQASEAAVKAASEAGILARTRFVHFATHGILGMGPGRQPALVLSLVGNDTEDGFLQLEEVTRLKLNADLVVLSACQSGQGRLARGEGVSSLGRAFLYAGSRGVLCSLWSVNDEATARLMQQLYSQMEAGRSAADALQTVQRAMIRDGQAPFFWAPFILIGE